MSTKIRQSKQRNAIYDVLMRRNTHLTAQEIYEDTRKVIPDISLGTVYRNLNFLVEHESIKRLDVGDNKIYYDPDLTSHHHFVCEKCGKVLDVRINENLQTALENEVEATLGHQIHSSQVVFHGVCSVCVNSNEEEEKNEFKRNSDSN